MSAINVLIQSSAVHVFTDAAIYQTDGTLAGIGPKVRLLPHINAAMAMRGAYLGLAPIAEELSAAASFDDLKAGIVPTLQACAEHYAHLLNQCAAGPDFEIVVAGMSETTGPIAYLVASHDRYGEPWNIINLEGLSVTPANAAVHRIIAEIANGREADDLDPSVDGLAVLEAQRALAPGAFVGGFAQLTTVTADSVTSRILRRWPDEIGKRVGAAAYGYFETSEGNL